MASSTPYFVFHYVLLLSFFCIAIQAEVPADQTFTFINHGEFGPATAEYNAKYRVVRTKNVNFFTSPFQLCFYSTTPGAYTLGIGAGVPGDQSPMRWVWDANRNHPIGENATLSFGSDGNLVLTDGRRIFWQSNTRFRGVTAIQLLPNGNLVLHDSAGRPIWQSFDHPSDTLLVGQSLWAQGVNRLVSRKSDADASIGPYSLVHQKNHGLYLFVTDSRGQLIRYSGWLYSQRASTVIFDGKAADSDNQNNSSTSYELAFTVYRNQRTTNPPAATPAPSDIFTLRRVSYNATLSFVRIGSDGNLKAYTYVIQAGSNGRGSRWEESFAYFSAYYTSRCSLPTRCGSFGLCERGTCLACPTPSGLVGWNKSCAPPKLPACQSRTAAAKYFNVTGARHFTSDTATGGEGMTLEECKSRCDAECACLGFVMFEDFRCIIATVLGTLTKTDRNHTAYIKY